MGVPGLQFTRSHLNRPCAYTSTSSLKFSSFRCHLRSVRSSSRCWGNTSISLISDWYLCCRPCLWFFFSYNITCLSILRVIFYSATNLVGCLSCEGCPNALFAFYSSFCLHLLSFSLSILVYLFLLRFVFFSNISSVQLGLYDWFTCKDANSRNFVRCSTRYYAQNIPLKIIIGRYINSCCS